MKKMNLIFIIIAMLVSVFPPISLFAQDDEGGRELLKKIQSLRGYDIPDYVWSNCSYRHNGEAILDMTTDTWCNLSVADQQRYATEYQAGYAKAKGLEPEKRVTKSGATFTLRLIPPGRFWMGSPDGEKERGSDEKRHRVVISKPYYLATTEVTQGQWQAVMGNNPASFKDVGSNAPVETVSWDDCQGFCSQAGFKLPTEAQWEYACRAGTTSVFNLGANITPQQANYNGIYPYAGGSTGTYREKTVAVGSLGNANAWGLSDMHGNVWEWCQDWDGDYDSDAIDPAGASSGSYRVLRGGSWFISGKCCRSAYRYSRSAADRTYRDNFGLRVVLVL